MLDVVSGGRLDVGIGRGGTLQDYQTFQSDREDSRARVEEGIALIQQCWSGQPFDFRGRFHSAERLHVRPRPRAAAVPAAVRRRQQRGQRALGRAHGPADAVVVLRADRRAAAPPRRLSRGGAGRRPLAGRDRAAGGARVGHARRAHRGEPAGGAARDRGAVHGLPAADGGAADGQHGRVGAQFVRSHLRAPAAVPRLHAGRPRPLRHARRGPRGAAAATWRPLATSASCC